MGKKHTAEIKKIIIETTCCGEIIRKCKGYDFSAWEQECGLCGSHGGIEYSFECDCGRRYKIELYDW
jgi:hypothetical protein